MNKLFSDDDINWFKDINIKKNKNYSYGIEIKFININKNAYFNILDNFKNVISKNSEFYEYIKYNKSLIYIKKEYINHDIYKIKKRMIFKYLDTIPACILLNSEIVLNRKINIDNNFKKIKKEKKSFMIKNIFFNFIILNNNEYNIEIKIKDLKNIDDIEMIYFNRLNHIIKHIPNENYIIHKLYLYKIKGLMKQPIPLKSVNDIKTNFAVTQKFDGIRSLMFINEYGKVFLIKNNLTIIIKTNLMCDYLSNVIIDGELINDDIFYAIDIILYDNINLEEYNLKSRINILKNISFIKNNYDKNIYYKVKKYYFNNILEHCKKLSKIKNYHIINKMKYEIPVDGLIFNSMSENYRNCKIYKWKPIITFDFKILKCQYNSGEYILWKLYCYTYNKEYILFPIEKYNKVLINYKLDKLYNNNEIIEFIFDENNDSFYPIKVRNDKIYPNFVNVAIDNWNCLDINIRF